MLWSFQDGLNLGLQQCAEFLAAFDGLAQRPFPQRIQDFGRGLDAYIAGKQRRFKVFQGGFVHRPGQGDNVANAGRKGFAGACNGLLQAAEKARLGPQFRSSLRAGSVLRLRRVLPVIFSAKESDHHRVQL